MVALAKDEADLDSAFAEGFYDMLEPAELELVRAQSYPLGIGKVATLVGVTPRQVRHWEQQGLIAAHQVGAQKRYLRGAVLRAMVFGKQDQHVLATLVKGGKDPGELLRLLALVITARGDGASAEALADELAALSRSVRAAAA